MRLPEDDLKCRGLDHLDVNILKLMENGENPSLTLLERWGIYGNMMNRTYAGWTSMFEEHEVWFSHAQVGRKAMAQGTAKGKATSKNRALIALEGHEEGDLFSLWILRKFTIWSIWGGSNKWRYPKRDGFIMGNPKHKWMIQGKPIFLETLRLRTHIGNGHDASSNWVGNCDRTRVTLVPNSGDPTSHEFLSHHHHHHHHALFIPIPFLLFSNKNYIYICDYIYILRSWAYDI